MEFKLKDRKTKTLFHLIRCPVCGGEVKHLRILGKDLRQLQGQLTYDFCFFIRYFTPETYLLLEISSYLCPHCGFATLENLAFRREIQKTTLFRQSGQKKRLKEVLTQGKLEKNLKMNLNSLMGRDSEMMEEVQRDENLYHGTHGLDGSSDSLSASLEGGQDPQKKTSKIITNSLPGIARRNLHLKIQNSYYGMLHKWFLITQNPDAAKLIEFMGSSKKVDADISRLFNEFYFFSAEFDFDFQLLWRHLKKKIHENILGYPDKTIFGPDFLKASGIEKISDEDLFFQFFRKISLESNGPLACDLTFDSEGQINGLKNIIYEQEASNLLLTKDQNLASLKTEEESLAQLEARENPDPTVRSMIMRAQVQINLLQKTILDYDVLIKVNEMKSSLLEFHFKTEKFRISQRKATLSFTPEDLTRGRGKILPFIEDQMDRLKNHIRQMNLAETYTRFKIDSNQFLENYSDFENHPLKQVFIACHQEKGALPFDPESDFNPADQAVVNFTTMDFRLKMEMECDLFRGAFPDKLLLNVATQISFVLSKIYAALLDGRENPVSFFYPFFQKIPDLEKKFRLQMAQNYISQNPGKNLSLEKGVIRDYLKIVRDPLQTIKFIGTYKLLNLFWITNFLESCFTIATEDLPPMFEKQLLELNSTSEEVFYLSGKNGKTPEEWVELGNKKSLLGLVKKKVDSLLGGNPHREFFTFYAQEFSDLKARFRWVSIYETPALETLYFSNFKSEGFDIKEGTPFDPNFNKGALLHERDLPLILFLAQSHFFGGTFEKGRSYFHLINQFKQSKKITDGSEIFKLYELFKETTAEFSTPPVLYFNLPEKEVLGEIATRIKGTYRHNYRYES